jgi:hypothetical protein
VKPIPRLLVLLFVALVTAGASSCDSGGIGLQVPHSGARWSGPGPDVLVGGGPP